MNVSSNIKYILGFSINQMNRGMRSQTLGGKLKNGQKYICFVYLFCLFVDFSVYRCQFFIADLEGSMLYNTYN